MKIGIDARLIRETGVGRYIQNLIRELTHLDTRNSYVIFLRKKDFRDFQLPNNRWAKRPADVRWHTVAEQFIMPFLYSREKLDVVHVPYFNAPIFYPGKYIVTIHDLTILHFDTGKASMLPYWLYKIRRMGYRAVLTAGVKRAAQIITVSKAVKHDIVTYFGDEIAKKTSVTYEGVDPAFLDSKFSQLPPSLKARDFFLYVGNVYPHKNIERMLEAYELYKKSVKTPATLVFVGPRDYFYRKLEALVTSLNLDSFVLFMHDVPDSQLRSLYHSALSLLFPSRMEGFGLPALETLLTGGRVLCSDIPVFHEILGSHAVFANTKDVREFAKKMSEIQPGIKGGITAKDKESLLSQFSWEKMSKETIDLYTQAGQS